MYQGNMYLEKVAIQLPQPLRNTVNAGLLVGHAALAPYKAPIKAGIGAAYNAIQPALSAAGQLRSPLAAIGSTAHGAAILSGLKHSQLARELYNSPYTQGVIRANKAILKDAAKQVRKNAITNTSNAIVEKAPGVISSLIRKATGQPEPMSFAQKAMIGTGIGAVGVGGGLLGYEALNKEASYNPYLQKIAEDDVDLDRAASRGMVNRWVRSNAEELLGAGLGAGLGAVGAKLFHANPHVLNQSMLAGSIVGGSIGGVHGSHSSIRNTIRDNIQASRNLDKTAEQLVHDRLQCGWSLQQALSDLV